MWYVLQTLTGKEEDLVYMIKSIVPCEMFSDCFVAYYERVWRKQGKSVIHVERMFPGYVFVISDKPDKLFQQLKAVPAMSKLISDGSFTFLALEEEEETFFEDMLGEDRIVRLSYVKVRGKDKIDIISQPLRKYKSQIMRYQLKKRYAILNLKMLGRDKTIALGIILDEDIRQEIVYGKIETPLKMPKEYLPLSIQEEELLAVGDHVKVVSGTLENMTGVIWKIKKNTVEIGVRLFGQDMAMEIPRENICKSFL